MGLLNINCNQGKMLCDKRQYNEASLWEKVKLSLYLIVCSECRSYTNNNVKLTKAMKNPKVHSVSNSEKNALKERLAREMSQ
jgi:hypothetical protein